MAVIGVALAQNATTATRVALNFQCDVSATVGDLVKQSSTVSEKVDVLSTNTDIGPCIGVILEKPQPQIAKVLLLGVKEGFAGLTVGAKVFLSTTGSVTTTKPTTGYLHILGVALASDAVLFIPNNIRTKFN